MKQLNNEKLFAFVLGREQKIALLELESVLRSFCFCSDKNNPELCREVDYSILSVTGNVVIINIQTQNYGGRSILSRETESYKLEAKSLAALLGGTIKIFKIVSEGSNNLINDVAKIVQESSVDLSGKLNFGISDYRSNKVRAKNDINKIGLSVKKILKKSHSTRFVALKEGNELASIVTYKNKLDTKGIEIGLFPIRHSRPDRESTNRSEKLSVDPRLRGDDRILLGRLLAVTNPEEWSKRDYGKPRKDKFSGMTPPKLARMLLNITFSQAISNNQDTNSKQIPNSKIQINDYVVLDPFCGSGNILMEAVMLGCEVVGSDISERAVNDTKANLEWLQKNFQFSIFNFQSNSNNQIPINQTMKQSSNETMIFQADATTSKFREKLEALNSKLETVVVTEPYLGQPKKFKPSLNAAKGEYKKVKKLYLDFLANLKASSRKPQAICIIFPLVETQEGKQHSLLNECIDEIKEMGYAFTCDLMIYGRSYQVVKREIVFLKIPKSK